jgi:hypothetical protein
MEANTEFLVGDDLVTLTRFDNNNNHIARSGF